MEGHNKYGKCLFAGFSEANNCYLLKGSKKIDETKFLASMESLGSLWHKRFGHVHLKGLEVADKRIVKGIP